MSILLKGIIPPIITPLKNEDELDEQGLKQLIERLIGGGVHGIFLLGTTGEATNLSYQLRKEFIKKACSYINNRVTVVVGITDTSVKCSLDIANAAKEAGADALVLSAPYYLPMTQNEFVKYLEYITPLLPLPFVLYNMPSCTKFHMSVETVRHAQKLGALGIKDSSGDMAYLYSLMNEFKDTPEFSLIVGTEMFIPETMMNGGHGAVPGGANLFPKLFVDLYEASKNKDVDKIEQLREKLVQINNKIYSVNNEGSRHIKSIKCALSALGICNDFVAMPFSRFEGEIKKQIGQNIKEIEFNVNHLTS